MNYKYLSHNPKWPKIIKDCFNYKIINFNNFQFLNKKNVLFGNCLISLPYLNGPSNEVENLKEIIADIKKYQIDNNISYVEIRSRKQICLPQLIERCHKVTFILDLSLGSDEIWNNLGSKMRNQINKPYKSNPTIEMKIGSDIKIEDVKLFYKVFSKHMRNLGTPCYSFSFFKNILDNFSEEIIICLIKVDNQYCTTGFGFINNNTFELMWAASLSKYNKYAVNMLLYWELIKKCSELGLENFDFGRCSKESGGYKFKKQWKATEKQLYWYYTKESILPDISPKNKTFSLAISFWKKLPLPIANFLGRFISPYLP